jgi:hypothetical protein
MPSPDEMARAQEIWLLDLGGLANAVVELDKDHGNIRY